MSDTKREHPCTKFQRGEVHDFATACRVFVEQFEEEYRITCELDREYPGDTPAKRTRQYRERMKIAENLEQLRVRVAQALRIHDEIMGEAIARTAARIREEVGDREVDELARALERGYYNDLSV